MKPLNRIDLSNITDETAPYLREHVIFRTYGNKGYQSLLIPLLEYYEHKIEELEKEITNAETS